MTLNLSGIQPLKNMLCWIFHLFCMYTLYSISGAVLFGCFNLTESFCWLLQVHCVWAAAEAYSAPSIVLTSHSHDGLHVFDDFREAYAWLKHNTDVDDKVISHFLLSISLHNFWDVYALLLKIIL